MMNGKTRKLTISAVLAAMTVALLYFASFFPTGQLGFVAITSLFTVVAVIEAGLIYGLFLYICCSVLAFLIVPMKGAMLLYVLFFGYYSVIKSLAEQLNNRTLSWIFKEVVFIIALSIIWFVFKNIIFTPERASLNTVIVYILGIIIFTLYDIGLTKLIRYYLIKISPKFYRK